ncbi:MAG: hypothetical protein Q8P18_17725 [Pseudomonadota bacterium]|nr:hypothetical protein [Pseudomonadota bacterium]
MTTILLSLLALPAQAATTAGLRAGLAEEAGWKEITRKDVADVGEIMIRHKEIEGVDCLEGSTSAALPPDALLAASADIPNQPSWSSWKVVASVRLSGDTKALDYYQVLDNPSPIADRYWFLHGTAGRVGDDRVFTWELVDPVTAWPAALADVAKGWPDAVMTRVNVGNWTFSPQGQQTRIRYRICTDAGGNIPRWVGEIAATKTLPTNIADIVKEVRRRVGG